mgnify:CR=1 FL=1
MISAIGWGSATAEKTTNLFGMNAVAGRRSVATWLFVCAAFVLAMVVIGGITRLTRSGLSIVEWKPLTGALDSPGRAPVAPSSTGSMASSGLDMLVGDREIQPMHPFTQEMQDLDSPPPRGRRTRQARRLRPPA